MSAHAPSTEPTNPSNEAVRDLVEEQRALTLALTSHPDPHVRLVAHMSERQLALVELVTVVRDEMRKGFQAVHEKIDGLSGRQDTLENRYNGNSYELTSADGE